MGAGHKSFTIPAYTRLYASDSSEVCCVTYGFLDAVYPSHSLHLRLPYIFVHDCSRRLVVSSFRVPFIERFIGGGEYSVVVDAVYGGRRLSVSAKFRGVSRIRGVWQYLPPLARFLEPCSLSDCCHVCPDDDYCPGSRVLGSCVFSDGVESYPGCDKLPCRDLVLKIVSSNPLEG